MDLIRAIRTYMCACVCACGRAVFIICIMHGRSGRFWNSNEWHSEMVFYIFFFIFSSLILSLSLCV